MERKTLQMTVEASSTGFSIYADGVPVHGYGKTVDEAKKDLAAGFADLMGYYSTKGIEPPAELNGGNIDFEYHYDIASIFEEFGMLDVTNFAKKIGMNTSLLRQYKTGSANAGKKAKEKIEAGLHALGRELLSVRL